MDVQTVKYSSPDKFLKSKVLLRLYGMLLIFIGLFPNLSLLGLDYIGSQPNDILLCLAIFPFLGWNTYPKNLLLLVAAALFSIVVLVISPLDFNSFRSVINYASLAFVPLVIYKIMSYLTEEDFKKVLKVGIWIWFIVAMVQYLFIPDFLSFLLPHQSGSLLSGRGVTSMATEPTYYGYAVCMMMCLVLVYFKSTERRNYFLFLLFQLFVLSLSTTAIASVILVTFLYFIFSSFKVRMTLLIIAIPIAIFIYYFLFIDTTYIDQHANEIRVLRLGLRLLENPEAAFVLDASGNRRFLAIFLSFRGSFDAFFMPHGYGHFNEYIFSDEVVTKFKSVISFLKDYGRIQSSMGAIFFELGFMGLVAIYGITMPFLRIKTEAGKYAMILFLFILVNPVPFTNSLVHLTIGTVTFAAYGTFSKKIARSSYA